MDSTSSGSPHDSSGTPTVGAASETSDNLTAMDAAAAHTKIGKYSRKSWNPLVLVLGLSFVFFVLFVIGSSVLFFMKQSGGHSSPSAKLFSKEWIGVVEINGVILDSKKTLHILEEFEEDPDIRGVLLRINSPGGAVGPSQEIYQAVKNYSKPVVASMGSVAASGGYYIAVGAPMIFANPGTLTGSIGVIMQFANLEKLYQWAKVERYAVKTGKFKDTGADYRGMSIEERELLQEMVLDVLDQFKEAVETGRKLKRAQVDPVADGRIFSGRQALELKLVDRLGGIQDAVDELAKQCGFKGKPELIYPHAEGSKLMRLLMGDDESEEGRWSGGSAAGTGAAGLSANLSEKVEQFLGINAGRGFSRLTPGLYWMWMGH